MRVADLWLIEPREWVALKEKKKKVKSNFIQKS